MTAFSAAVDTMFRDGNLAVDATYTPLVGSPIACRVMLGQPDEQTRFDREQYVSATTLLRVRTSEVAAPKEGESFTVGTDTYIVQGVPRRDPHRLVWTCEAPLAP